MKIRRTAVGMGCAALLLAGAGVASAQSRGSAESEGQKLRPESVKVSRQVSRALLGSQANEREAASEATEEIESALKDLRRSVDRLEAAERAREDAVRGSQGTASARSPRASRALQARSERRSEAQAAVAELRSKREALESRLAEVPSPRQRRIARRGIEKLRELETATEEAMNAAPSERAARLAEVENRLVVEADEPAAGKAEGATPTMRSLPADSFPPIETIDSVQ